MTTQPLQPEGRFRPGKRLLEALEGEGLHVRQIPGWRNRRTRGPFQPVGIILHDTVRAQCVDLIVDGRPGISGPLANLLISKDGSVDLISSNRSHHAGRGSEKVLAEVSRGLKPPGDAGARGLADSLIGNSFFYGIEVDNRSDGHDPYPDVQMQALVCACLAIRSLHPEWKGFREIFHREWTSRKTDMRYGGNIADLVAAALASRIKSGNQRAVPRRA